MTLATFSFRSGLELGAGAGAGTGTGTGLECTGSAAPPAKVYETTATQQVGRSHQLGVAGASAGSPPEYIARSGKIRAKHSAQDDPGGPRPYRDAGFLFPLFPTVTCYDLRASSRNAFHCFLMCKGRGLDLGTKRGSPEAAARCVLRLLPPPPPPF